MKTTPYLLVLLLAGGLRAAMPLTSPPNAAWFNSALPVARPDLLADFGQRDRPSARGESGTISTPELATSEPVLMAPYEVKELPDRTYRELTEYATMRALLTPCVIFTHDLKNTRQLQFIGAPLSSVPGENAADSHQARFPLVTLAW